MEIFVEKVHICPWQSGPLLTITLRKLIHNPRQILGSYVTEGMTAMDVGCGMGFFTFPMADAVGKQGKVIAIDLQPEMLAGLQNNVNKVGNNNITAHLCSTDSLRVEQWNGTVGFVLVFMMLHEVPDAERLIQELHAVLALNGKLLFAEPVMHVSSKKYEQSLDMIKQTGFIGIDTPKIALCRSIVFQKIN